VQYIVSRLGGELYRETAVAAQYLLLATVGVRVAVVIKKGHGTNTSWIGPI
jgi:hypothetical protein